MARKKTVSIEYIADIAADNRPQTSEYVRNRWSDEGPYSALLWQEVRRMEMTSKMTAKQASVFEWHLIGLTNVEIARLLGISEAAVRKNLTLARKKAARCRDVGILTVLVESCGGWDAVKEVLE